jgi:flagellar biosynthesis protein FlhA
MGLSPSEAAQRFLLLTVGDGLVTQIPALLISTATGLVLTRAASEDNLGHDVARQLLAQPRAVLIVAVMMVAFGLVPGLPKVCFLAVGGVTFAVGRTLLRAPAPAAEPVGATGGSPLPEGPEDFADLLDFDRIALEVGYNLIPLVDAGFAAGATGGSLLQGSPDDPTTFVGLLDRVTGVRRQAALELGLVVPPIRIRDDMTLGANEYAIRLRDVIVARSEVHPGELLAISPGPDAEPLPGTPTVEPAFGLPAVWIKGRDRSVALARGYSTVDASTVVATHLSETIKRHAAEVLSRQDVQQLLDTLRRTQPAVVDGLVPDVATVGDVQQVLERLLAEAVPIRDLTTILEAMSDGWRRSSAPQEAGVDQVVETVRQALARRLCSAWANRDGTLHLLLVSPALERVLLESLLRTETGTVCAPPPDLVQALARQVGELREGAAVTGHDVVVLTAPQTRRHVRALLERHTPDLPVMSHAEVVPGLTLQAHGVLDAGVVPAPAAKPAIAAGAPVEAAPAAEAA